jgi:hypothetical protein
MSVLFGGARLRFVVAHRVDHVLHDQSATAGNMHRSIERQNQLAAHPSSE